MSFREQKNVSVLELNSLSEEIVTKYLNMSWLITSQGYQQRKMCWVSNADITAYACDEGFYRSSDVEDCKGMYHFGHTTLIMSDALIFTTILHSAK